MSPSRHNELNNDFADVGFNQCQDYNFETAENDISIQHERTDRDFLDGYFNEEVDNDVNMIEMSDQKDLIPKAMKPHEFDSMAEEIHLDRSIDGAD